MPYAIEPHEVLAYLNDLGYKNISAQQLKEFIRDLKKLIKYDLRIRKRREEDIENVPPKDGDDIFRALYETRTTSSRAKEVPKKEKVITVQIKKPPRRTFEDKSSPSIVNSTSTSNPTPRVEDSGEMQSFNDEGYVEEKTRPKSSDNIDAMRSLHKGAQLRPKTSFIRPRMHLRPCKSDPVALYHAYQAEWKKQKFPGEENHANLRWAIRERMLGEPPQGFHHPAGSMEALSKKRGPPRRT